MIGMAIFFGEMAIFRRGLEQHSVGRGRFSFSLAIWKEEIVVIVVIVVVVVVVVVAVVDAVVEEGEGLLVCELWQGGVGLEGELGKVR